MRLVILHYIAKFLRVPFKVDGFPYGFEPHQFRPGAFNQSPHV
jgi:hypothetical protein